MLFLFRIRINDVRSLSNFLNKEIYKRSLLVLRIPLLTSFGLPLQKVEIRFHICSINLIEPDKILLYLVCIHLIR
jgi:hypothetical protein